MRDILFRGKDYTDNWIFGNLIIDEDGDCHIIENNNVIKDGHHLYFDTDRPLWVDNKTIGQYTGMTDKNGVKIFEGDIVREEIPDDYPRTFLVGFDFGCFYACKNEYYCFPLNMCGYDDANSANLVKVIGNIYDNPELLGVSNG